jgi:Ca2+-binding RTX toxin-like protein
MRATVSLALALSLMVVFTPVSQASAPTCAGSSATIVGTSGNDTLTGTAGGDVIVGLEGNDVIHGGGGSDIICGNKGADTIYGEDDPDNLLAGGNGNDRIYGGADSGEGDTLDGGGGNDVIDGGSTSGDFGDVVLYDAAPGPVNVNLDTGVATGYGTDSLSGIENVLGSSFADTIVGGTSFIQGLQGGDGNDYIKLTSNANFVIGGNGVDTIKMTPGVFSDAGLIGGPGNDIFIGSHAADSLNVQDSSGNETVYGRDGNDTINMTDGQPGDTANGQAGTDSCNADPGDQTLNCES